MAMGQKSFSSSNRTVQAPMRFELIPPGEYEAVLRTNKTKVSLADGPGKLPYVACHIELLNTATGEGGKNRVIFHNFFPWLYPCKDGVAMIDRANGLVAFARAVNTSLDLPAGAVIKMKKNMAAEGETLDLKEVELIQPKMVEKWLAQFDGTVFKLVVKTDKAQKGYDAKSVVDYFIEADTESSGEEEEISDETEEIADPESDEESADESEEIDSEEETEEAEESEEEDAEIVEEEEEAPPPPPKKKVVAKPAPAKKAAPAKKKR